MSEFRNLAESASFTIFKKIIPLVFFLVTLVVVLPFFVLAEKYKIEVLHAVGGVLFLIGLLATIFTSREIAIRMDQDKSMLFSEALAHTLYRYLTLLCFVPILGPRLQRFLESKRAKNPFTGDGSSPGSI